MQAFQLHMPDADLRDLRERLARTRLPDEAPGVPWTTGTSLDYARDLLRYWRDDFDWRTQEARINEFPQYKVALDGIDLHFIHAPGRCANPAPLLLSHGWPGSIVEFLDLIPLLTERYTVVAPSLPGYTLSFRPGQPRFSIEQMADCFATLMTDVLGYRQFFAQGGDWGAFITTRLAATRPELLRGIHLNYLIVPRVPFTPTTPEEHDWQAQLDDWTRERAAYSSIQGTRPQTLAYGLTDSPAGLATWIAEKFHAWTDNDGRIESAVSRDTMLANIALYWFTGAIGASFWPYYARLHGGWPIPLDAQIRVPTAHAVFPREILRPPRSIAARTYSNLIRWTVMPHGGHFAAMEQPALLAEDITAAFAGL